jgi:hypothetical protein
VDSATIIAWLPSVVLLAILLGIARLIRSVVPVEIGVRALMVWWLVRTFMS